MGEGPQGRARSLAERGWPSSPRTYSHGVDVGFVANEGLFQHMESRTSHSLMEASQAPDTKVWLSGARDRDITSPLCPAKPTVCWPVSMSHRALER